MKFARKYFSPSQLSKIYWVIGIVALFGGLVVIMKMLEPEVKVRKKPPTVETVITGKNTRQFGLDAVNDKLVGVAKNDLKQQKIIEQQANKIEQLEAKLKASAVSQAEDDDLIKKVEALSAKLEKLESTQHSNPSNQGAQGNGNSTNAKHPDLKVDPNRRKVTGTSFSYGNRTNSTDGGRTAATNGQSETKGVNQPSTNGSSSSIEITILEDKQEFVSNAVEQKPVIRLPKGSMLTGVLLTGLDAPTAASAKDSPVPILVRIKKEAILPNYQTVQEVNECFAIMAGYGDLSSERAMIRGESITCVRHDKTIIEADFSAYAVGEDSKNGLKGTLVTRNSTVLANSMMAGFAAGMASMFDVSPVPVISTDATGQQQYQDVFNSDAIGGGAAKGASEAMTRLADYYLKLADQIHPIIEVGAGRVIDMVVTEGVNL
ncbi:TrbI/VirB10 family protein [Vibrio coralliilyticus]|uniref:Conjugal transfer protein TraB n=1 Tax=Vibrio coralliilyticus TaxID=190893 RepID=A0AAP6ZRG1_9VIBR|nr:TrbI/VirB10 family protein [Vibrio coralliilyticus]NOI31837.1 hypothetical protein [Vibrio coralliilyticus]NOJ25281.1 hypothetical protein [Vibrio coralliilyticus]